MPTGALLGAVVGLGLLANHSELTVMRSVGLSVYRIVGWVLVPAMLFVALALAVNQFVLPTSNQLASQIRDPDASLLASVSGYWTVQEGNSDSADRAGERDIVFIDYADENGNLGEVKRWRIDADNNLVSVSQAENGRYVRDRQSENNQSKDNQNEGKKGEIASESDTYEWQLSDVTTLNLQPLVQVRKYGYGAEQRYWQCVHQPTPICWLMASSQPLVTQTATASEQVTLPISPTSVHLLTRRAGIYRSPNCMPSASLTTHKTPARWNMSLPFGKNCFPPLRFCRWWWWRVRSCLGRYAPTVWDCGLWWRCYLACCLAMCKIWSDLLA